MRCARLMEGAPVNAVSQNLETTRYSSRLPQLDEPPARATAMRSFVAFLLVGERDTKHLESFDVGERLGRIRRNQAQHRSRYFSADKSINRFSVASC